MAEAPTVLSSAGMTVVRDAGGTVVNIGAWLSADQIAAGETLPAGYTEAEETVHTMSDGSRRVASGLATEVRRRRDRLLSACDWTQAADSPVQSDAPLLAAWQTYRQALRDITDQPGFPTTVTWPDAPQ